MHRSISNCKQMCILLNGMSVFGFALISTQVPEAVLHTIFADSASEK